jgi:hypothetical protein
LGVSHLTVKGYLVGFEVLMAVSTKMAVFWVLAPCSLVEVNFQRIFTLQKKIIRIMAGAKPRNLCRSLFKKLEILPLPCECIFSSMNIINNLERFQTNSTVHSVNTKNKNYLHRPVANLSCFQKGAHYAGIKVFNSLPPSLKTILDKKETFKVAFKRLLNTHTHLLFC